MGLYEDLNELEANEILVVLSENGIKATKDKEVRQNEIFWKISVADRDVAAARALLVRHRLPHRAEPGLRGVYEEKGLIPTPDEQRARYLLALKGEIINSLESIPDVIDADIVLNVPSPEEFAEKGAPVKRPTASVVLQVRGDRKREDLTEGKIQQFIANSIERMLPQDVTVILSRVAMASTEKPEAKPASLLASAVPAATEEVPTREIAGLSLAPASADRLKLYFIIFLGILAVLAVALIVTVVKASRLRQEMESLRQVSAGPALEGKVVGEVPTLREGRKE